MWYNRCALLVNIKNMTLEQIASRLVELCRKGEWETVFTELMAPEWKQYEAETYGGEVRQGMEQAMAASAKWKADTLDLHMMEIGDPIFGESTFALRMFMDMTSKTQGRQAHSELCVYEVKDGKIVAERFFA